MDKQTLQSKFDELEREKSALNPVDDKFRITVIEQEQARITAQIAELDRLEQQAEAVATVVLPQDYDALWGVTGANEEITALIKQAYEQAFGAGNDEIAQIRDEYQAKLEASEQERQSLAAKVESLEDQVASAVDAAKKADTARQDAEDAKADAEAKRDNAVRLLEEAQADRDKAITQVDGLKRQIDELEGMLRTYKSRTAAGGTLGGLKLTSTLPAESEQERKAREERERLEQINKSLARLGTDPLPLPYITPAPKQDERFPMAEEAVDAGGLAEGDAPVEMAGEDAEELTLEQKVDVLWQDYQSRRNEPKSVA